MMMVLPLFYVSGLCGVYVIDDGVVVVVTCVTFVVVVRDGCVVAISTFAIIVVSSMRGIVVSYGDVAIRSVVVVIVIAVSAVSACVVSILT